MEHESAHSPTERPDEEREVHERLALPLLVPAIIFLFAVLVIYGLSRIYLELDTFRVGDVTMATPLAIGVALAILAVASYLATRPRILRWQIAAVGALAVALLTGGAIWAAVHEEEEPELVVTPVETPIADGGPVTEGAVLVELVDPDWAVKADPASTAAGSVTFSVSNAGNVLHNFRAIRTDIDPDALPLDESGFQADEAQVEVVGALPEFPAGETQQVSVELAAGSYVLICNVPSHYQAGMYTAFTVE